MRTRLFGHVTRVGPMVLAIMLRQKPVGAYMVVHEMNSSAKQTQVSISVSISQCEIIVGADVV